MFLHLLHIVACNLIYLRDIVSEPSVKKHKNGLLLIQFRQNVNNISVLSRNMSFNCEINSSSNTACFEIHKIQKKPSLECPFLNNPELKCCSFYEELFNRYLSSTFKRRMCVPRMARRNTVRSSSFKASIYISDLSSEDVIQKQKVNFVSKNLSCELKTCRCSQTKCNNHFIGSNRMNYLPEAKDLKRVCKNGETELLRNNNDYRGSPPSFSWLKKRTLSASSYQQQQSSNGLIDQSDDEVNLIQTMLKKVPSDKNLPANFSSLYDSCKSSKAMASTSESKPLNQSPANFSDQFTTMFNLHRFDSLPDASNSTISAVQLDRQQEKTIIRLGCSLQSSSNATADVIINDNNESDRIIYEAHPIETSVKTANTQTSAKKYEDKMDDGVQKCHTSVAKKVHFDDACEDIQCSQECRFASDANEPDISCNSALIPTTINKSNQVQQRHFNQPMHNEKCSKSLSDTGCAPGFAVPPVFSRKCSIFEAKFDESLMEAVETARKRSAQAQQNLQIFKMTEKHQRKKDGFCMLASNVSTDFEEGSSSDSGMSSLMDPIPNIIQQNFNLSTLIQTVDECHHKVIELPSEVEFSSDDELFPKSQLFLSSKLTSYHNSLKSSETAFGLKKSFNKDKNFTSFQHPRSILTLASDCDSSKTFSKSFLLPSSLHGLLQKPNNTDCIHSIFLINKENEGQRKNESDICYWCPEGRRINAESASESDFCYDFSQEFCNEAHKKKMSATALIQKIPRKFSKSLKKLPSLPRPRNLSIFQHYKKQSDFQEKKRCHSVASPINDRYQSVITKAITKELVGRRKSKSTSHMDTDNRSHHHRQLFTLAWRKLTGQHHQRKGDKSIVGSHGTAGSALNREWEVVAVRELARRLSIDDFEPAELPLPEGSLQSQILDEFMVRQIVEILPPRAAGYPWVQIYSSEKHGFSLSTFYRRMAEWNEEMSPVLIIIRDTANHVFGSICSTIIHPAEHYYGTGDSSFLFRYTGEYPHTRELQVYNWTGDNQFFINATKDFLSFGAGRGHFGLWLDSELNHGRSQSCSTFNNEPLAGGSEDFVVQFIEAFGFTMSS